MRVQSALTRTNQILCQARSEDRALSEQARDFDGTTHLAEVSDEQVSVWKTLHHTIQVLESPGVPAARRLPAASNSRTDGGVELELVKELAFLLYSFAEKNKWTRVALSFSSIATSSPDIAGAFRNQDSEVTSQSVFDYTAVED